MDTGLSTTHIEHGPAVPHRPSRRTLTVAGALAAVGATIVGTVVWAMPREDVPLPGPEASPEQVVTAYLDAVRARDFDTANAIDGRERQHIGRLGRPQTAENVRISDGSWSDLTSRPHVVFMADFGDGAEYEDEWWGYYLEHDDDGRWVIVDAGVA